MTDKERFTQLSWDLLAYKLFYYYPEKVHPSWHEKLDIPDSDYDELEKEYLRLCLKLDTENYTAGQTEVDGVVVAGKGQTQLDETRHSVQQTFKKYNRRRIK